MADSGHGDLFQIGPITSFPFEMKAHTKVDGADAKWRGGVAVTRRPLPTSRQTEVQLVGDVPMHLVIHRGPRSVADRWRPIGVSDTVHLTF